MPGARRAADCAAQSASRCLEPFGTFTRILQVPRGKLQESPPPMLLIGAPSIDLHGLFETTFVDAFLRRRSVGIQSYLRQRGRRVRQAHVKEHNSHPDMCCATDN